MQNNTNSKTMNAVFALFFIAFGAFCLKQCVCKFLDDYNVVKNGTVFTGKIESVEIHSSVHRSGKHTYYEVFVRYKDGNTKKFRSFEKRQSFSESWSNVIYGSEKYRAGNQIVIFALDDKILPVADKNSILQNDAIYIVASIVMICVGVSFFAKGVFLKKKNED